MRLFIYKFVSTSNDQSHYKPNWRFQQINGGTKTKHRNALIHILYYQNILRVFTIFHVFMAIKMSQLPKNNNVMHRKIVFFFFVLCNGVGTFNLSPAVLVWNVKNRQFCISSRFITCFRAIKMGQLPKNNNVFHRKIVFFPFFAMVFELLT